MRKLEQKRQSPNDVFPSPVHDELVEFTPPAFVWLPEKGCDDYELVVNDSTEAECLRIQTKDKYFIPADRFPSGEYSWNIYSGGAERGWWRFRISDAATEFIVPGAAEILECVPAEHPRHIFRQEDISQIVRDNHEELDVLRRNIEIAIKQGMPPRPLFHHDPTALPYREAFGLHREYCDRNLVACALGHVLLNDKDAAEYARQSLLTIADWNPEGPCSVLGPWGDEFGLSHARCLPAVYDWTYDLFDSKERGYIENTIRLYAEQVEKRLRRIDFISHPGDSHAGRLPAYLGEAALVLTGSNQVEEQQVQRWLQYALDIYGSSFPFFGGRDGGWAQGTFYSSSYTKWYTPFFLAVEQICGFSFFEKPFFRNLSQFFIHFYGIGRESFPFGDGNWCKPDDVEWPGFCAQNPYRVYGERYGPDLAENWRRELNTPEYYKLHLLDIFIPKPEQRLPRENNAAENCRAFRDVGLISMHSDIRSPKHDIALLARASKYGNFSHSHADQGNFAIICNGKTMVGPSGYFGRGYGTAHHTNWTRQTFAHNCVTVDSTCQEWGTHTATGRIESLDDYGTHSAATLDLSASYPMLQSYRRTLLLLRPDIVVVIDDLADLSKHLFAWHLHSLSPPELEEDEILIKRDKSKCCIHMYASSSCTCFTHTDTFATPVNEGVTEQFAVEMPQQYHMKWEYSNAESLRIAAVFTLNDATVESRTDAGILNIRSGKGDISVSLIPDDDDALQAESFVFTPAVR